MSLNTKCINVLFFFVFLFFNITLAQKPNFNVKKHVEKFIIEFNGSHKEYRSGLLINDEKLFAEEFQDKSEYFEDKVLTKMEGAQKWANLHSKEYQVVTKRKITKEKILKLLTNVAVFKDFEKRFDSENSTVELINSELFNLPYKEDKIRALNLEKSKDELVQTGKMHAKKILRKFKGRLEYECCDAEYFDGKIFRADLRFRRIFKHAPILGDVSYVYVSIDYNGNLVRLKIKWPKIIDKGNLFEEAISIDEGYSYLLDVIDGKPEEVTNNQDDKISKISNITVDGVTLGWRPIEFENSIKLTPVFAFRVNNDVENGDSFLEYVQIPRLKKYLQ